MRACDFRHLSQSVASLLGLNPNTCLVVTGLGNPTSAGPVSSAPRASNHANLFADKCYLRPTRFVVAFGLLALAVPLLLTASCGGKDSTVSESLIHTVHREDLHITVRERAELQAETDTRVVSQLEGRKPMIHLIPEGSVVAKGDKRARQAILVAKAHATVKQARKNFEVMKMDLLAADSSDLRRRRRSHGLR